MEEKIFKPKYSSRMLIALPILVLMELFIMWRIIIGRENSPEIIFSALFFGFLIASLPYAFISKIVFRVHNFSIKKYLWPTKTIEYSDVVDIGKTAVKTRKGNFSLLMFSNSADLQDIFRKLIKQGKINRHQIEAKLIAQENLSQKALLPAGIISLILWSLMVFTWSFEKSFFREISFLGFFIPVYGLVYWFLKMRAEQ